MTDSKIKIDVEVSTREATKAINELTHAIKRLKRESPKWWQFWLWMPLINITKKK